MRAKATNQGDRSEQTRKKLLQSAIREFSNHGLAGARTDTIADSAGVNKALLYYYFKNKEGLYEAALEEVSAAVAERTSSALDARYSPGERLLRAVLTHFDRILTQHEFQQFMQQEMVRFRQGESDALPLIAKKVFKPMLLKLQETIAEGIKAGELCEADWLQVVYSMLGANVFYFLSAPMMRLTLPFDPFDNKAMAARRKAAVQFLGNALFVDRAHGANLAKRVLAGMPMPRVKNFDIWRKLS